MMQINRRGFLLGATALTVLSSRAKAAHAGVTVGAIRWDAWYIATDTDERPNVESALGPAKWQPRSPACATITNPYTVSFAGCGNQAQIDSEIVAAHAARIDYWGYVWYGEDDPMQNAWRLHQSSSIGSQINWVQVFGTYSTFVTAVASSLAANVAYFQQANYQKVLTNRPLVYVLYDATPLATVAASIATLRTACTTAGLGSPYIVLLVAAILGPAGAATARTTAGADAIGTYANLLAAPLAGTYAAEVTAAEGAWTSIAATGSPMIPTAITGADRRPRVERPVAWETATQKPYVGDGLYYAAGTPAQIATHVGDMVTWMLAHASACPAQTGLIYSWDEHDEGGSTLNPSLGTGSAILTAVGGAL